MRRTSPSTRTTDGVSARGPTLYLIRHGETDWNAEGRIQGARDIPLNDLGRVQAEEAARRLGRLAARVEDLDFVASPMGRARETMEILRGTLGLHPPVYRIDERLRELTFGDWEGWTWPEILAHDPARAHAREADKWGYAPPNGESYAMLAERVGPWFGELARDTVAVAHGGVARALMVLSRAVPPREAALADIWQGRVLVIGPGKADWV